ncbi:MAG: sulfite exporter TauE/SafE family protein [Sandaracinaceae bacterium]|nr:sulfite exporter TauE/SafE family protein [Sandaracinaceae bacterium]
MLHLAIGLAAGTLTTVAGMGGGMLVVVALSLVTSPLEAIAVSAPGLLVSNAHRAWLFRASLDRKVAGAFILGAAPAALAGSLVAIALPDAVLTWILVTVSLLATARALGWIRVVPGPRTLAPAGAVTGGLAAVSGAGLVGPVLLAAGLRGDVYVATASASAFAMHLGRIVGYGAGGLFDARSLELSALVLVGLLGGNFAGQWVRERIGEARSDQVGYAAMFALVALSLANLA